MFVKITTDTREVLERAIAEIVDRNETARFFVRRHDNAWTVIGHPVSSLEADMIIPLESERR